MAKEFPNLPFISDDSDSDVVDDVETTNDRFKATWNKWTTGTSVLVVSIGCLLMILLIVIVLFQDVLLRGISQEDSCSHGCPFSIFFSNE